MTKYEITEEFLKDLHGKVCGDIQQTLEKYYPGVFKNQEPTPTKGSVMVFRGGEAIYLVAYRTGGSDDLYQVNLMTGWTTSMPDSSFDGEVYKKIENGEVTIRINGGYLGKVTYRLDK